jgi:hypothetical protein
VTLFSLSFKIKEVDYIIIFLAEGIKNNEQSLATRMILAGTKYS